MAGAIRNWVRQEGIVAALLLAAVLALMTHGEAVAQSRQVADNSFVYPNADPAWPEGKGPNIHFSSENSGFVARGQAEPLMKLAQGDGFRAVTLDGPLTPESLRQGDILVLINAFVRESADFPAMDPPSAYSDDEIAAILQWVEDGGSLMILADHAPLGGGASKLAEAFGFSFLNGYVLNGSDLERRVVSANIDFTPGNGLNTDHPITSGGLGRPAIERFSTFGGQSFIPADEAVTLLRIPDGWTAIFTYRLTREFATAPRIDASGMAQGAVLEHGKGRVAVFTEAGSFSAQIIDRPELDSDSDPKMGFNMPEGAKNPEFILSVLRWLGGFQPGN